MTTNKDEEGFPIDLTNYPELAKLKNAGRIIRLVENICWNLKEQGCKCFDAQNMLDIQAKIFSDLELFKDMDIDKRSLEMEKFNE